MYVFRLMFCFETCLLQGDNFAEDFWSFGDVIIIVLVGTVAVKILEMKPIY